jgi:hypothetical protein
MGDEMRRRMCVDDDVVVVAVRKREKMRECIDAANALQTEGKRRRE